MAGSAAKKPGLVEGVKRFFRDAKGECKKVVWPTKKQIINNTGIVLVVMCIAAVFVGCLDGIASQLIRLFLMLVS